MKVISSRVCTPGIDTTPHTFFNLQHSRTFAATNSAVDIFRRIYSRQKTSWTILGYWPYRAEGFGIYASRDTIMAIQPGLEAKSPKRWEKQYRTEIAASFSSILSTFLAVRDSLSFTTPSLYWQLLSFLLIPWRHECKRTNTITSQIVFDIRIKLRNTEGSFEALRLQWQALP